MSIQIVLCITNIREIHLSSTKNVAGYEKTKTKTKTKQNKCTTYTYILLNNSPGFNEQHFLKTKEKIPKRS